LVYNEEITGKTMPSGEHPNSRKALETGKRFSPSYQPLNKGKRRDKLKEFIDKERVSIGDLRAILENLICSYSFGDFDAIHNPESGREELPVIIAAYMKAIMTDHRKGTVDTIERLIDRVHGKPTNTVDVKSDSGLSITLMTPEERDKRIEELLRKGEIGRNTSKPRRGRKSRDTEPS
jgi:hypothetical protein